MMYSNVIVGITISRGSFVFSQSRVKVSASLTNVAGLEVIFLSNLHFGRTFYQFNRTLICVIDLHM